MKRYILLFILAVPLLINAQSPEKLIARGEYDEAIEVSVKKLAAGKGNKDELYAALKHAYETANTEDNSKILSLKASGRPEIWFDVFLSYTNMQNRYLMVSAIGDQLVQDEVNIKLLNVNEDVEVSRQNAAAFLYAHAKSLLESDEKADAGMAFDELILISRLYENYLDVEQLLRFALGKSATLARLEVSNSSDASLSPDFISKMEDMALTYNERGFLDYVVRPKPDQHCSLILSIHILAVNVTPGTVNEKEYTASHKHPESFEDAYSSEAEKEEAKKHPDFNKCQIKEVYQLKTCFIKGNLKYIDAKSGKVLFQVPITASSIFEHKTATASGDMFACPPEVYKILETPQKKFPKNAEMISLAGKEFKLLVKGIIWDDAFIQD